MEQDSAFRLPNTGFGSFKSRTTVFSGFGFLPFPLLLEGRRFGKKKGRARWTRVRTDLNGSMGHGCRGTPKGKYKKETKKQALEHRQLINKTVAPTNALATLTFKRAGSPGLYFSPRPDQETKERRAAATCTRGEGCVPDGHQIRLLLGHARETRRTPVPLVGPVRLMAAALVKTATGQFRCCARVPPGRQIGWYILILKANGRGCEQRSRMHISYCACG